MLKRVERGEVDGAEGIAGGFEVGLSLPSREEGVGKHLGEGSGGVGARGFGFNQFAEVGRVEVEHCDRVGGGVVAP